MASTVSKITRAMNLLTTALLHARNSNTKYCTQIQAQSGIGCILQPLKAEYSTLLQPNRSSSSTDSSRNTEIVNVSASSPNGTKFCVHENGVQAYPRDSLIPRIIQVSEEDKKRGRISMVDGSVLTTPTQLQSLQNETGSCYDACSSLPLVKVATVEASQLLTTHNLESAKMAAAKAEELDIAMREGALHFDQLKGTTHSLSLGLCKAGLDVSKSLPFVPAEHANMGSLSERLVKHSGVIVENHLDMKPVRKDMDRVIQNSEVLISELNFTKCFGDF